MVGGATGATWFVFTAAWWNLHGAARRRGTHSDARRSDHGPHDRQHASGGHHGDLGRPDVPAFGAALSRAPAGCRKF